MTQATRHASALRRTRSQETDATSVRTSRFLAGLLVAAAIVGLVLFWVKLYG